MLCRATVNIAVLPIVLLGLTVSPLSASGQTPRELEGVWKLVEWTEDGETLCPPEVGGYFSLQYGIHMFHAFLHSNEKEISYQGYGSYDVTKDSFSYGAVWVAAGVVCGCTLHDMALRCQPGCYCLGQCWYGSDSSRSKSAFPFRYLIPTFDGGTVFFSFNGGFCLILLVG